MPQRQVKRTCERNDKAKSVIPSRKNRIVNGIKLRKPSLTSFNQNPNQKARRRTAAVLVLPFDGQRLSEFPVLPRHQSIISFPNRGVRKP